MADADNPKTVVCFGDSITWGFDPSEGANFVRFGFAERWTRRLQTELGNGYHVIEEGLSGRTAVFDDPVLGGMSGLADLPNTLKTHMPVDLLVIMLGSNDLKRRFAITADEIARALGRVVEAAATSTCGPEGKAPKILVLVPPNVGEIEKTFIGTWFDGDTARTASRQLSETYPPIAAAFGAECFDMSKIVGPGKIDGLHLDADQLEPFAMALAPVVRRLLKPDG
ncbi:MAG: GDSL-type esterase/lipase family protein [Pseudomonadota bacterium]